MTAASQVQPRENPNEYIRRIWREKMAWRFAEIADSSRENSAPAERQQSLFEDDTDDEQQALTA